MSYQVDFKSVSTQGLTSSPVAAALAGLRANEARYYMNKYQQPFVTESATDAPQTLAWVEKVLAERDLHFAAKPLEVAEFTVADIHFAYVFYEDGLVVNVMYAHDDAGKRAVGFKLADGMAVPAELEGKFKFARQKSKLAGTIRGSYFKVKGTY